MGNSPGMMIDPNGEMFERAQAGADAYTENPFPTSEANFYSSNRVWGINVMFGMNSAEVLDFNDNPSYKGTSSFGGGTSGIYKGAWFDYYEPLANTLDKSSGHSKWLLIIGPKVSINPQSSLREQYNGIYEDYLDPLSLEGLQASINGGRGLSTRMQNMEVTPVGDVLEGVQFTSKRKSRFGSSEMIASTMVLVGTGSFNPVLLGLGATALMGIYIIIGMEYEMDLALLGRGYLLYLQVKEKEGYMMIKFLH